MNEPWGKSVYRSKVSKASQKTSTDQWPPKCVDCTKTPTIKCSDNTTYSKIPIPSLHKPLSRLLHKKSQIPSTWAKQQSRSRQQVDLDQGTLENQHRALTPKKERRRQRQQQQKKSHSTPPLPLKRLIKTTSHMINGLQINSTQQGLWAKRTTQPYLQSKMQKFSPAFQTFPIGQASKSWASTFGYEGQCKHEQLHPLWTCCTFTSAIGQRHASRSCSSAAISRPAWLYCKLQGNCGTPRIYTFGPGACSTPPV